MTDWNALTKEELLHLITGDLEVESLILVHLVANVKGQRQMNAKCYTCESIVKKFAIPVTVDEVTKLEYLRVIRWLLHELGFSDYRLERAQELLGNYRERR